MAAKPKQNRKTERIKQESSPDPFTYSYLLGAKGLRLRDIELMKQILERANRFFSDHSIRIVATKLSKDGKPLNSKTLTLTEFVRYAEQIIYGWCIEHRECRNSLERLAHLERTEFKRMESAMDVKVR